MNGLQHLTQTFEAAERSHPDLMERYSARLGEAASADERMAIMRVGLRETICRRYPLAGETSPSSAHTDSLTSPAQDGATVNPHSARNPQASGR